MKLKSILSSDPINPTVALNLSDIANPHFFEIKDINLLLDNGFEQIDEHIRGDITFKDFEDSQKNAIQLVNDRFIVYKQFESHQINWKANNAEVLSFLVDPDAATTPNVSFVFSFPLGKYSEKYIFSWAHENNIDPAIFIEENPENNVLVKDMFFSVDTEDAFVKKLSEPLFGNFTKKDILNIGYVQSANKKHYFIEGSNVHYQNNFLPTLITFEDETPIAKKYEQDTPKGLITFVNLKEKVFEHENYSFQGSKEAKYYIIFNKESFTPVIDEIVLVWNAQRRNDKTLAPYIGYPNVFKIDNEITPKWYIGENLLSFDDVTEKALDFIKDSNYEELSDFKQAHFNYIFKIGDYEAFEDILDMIDDPDNIDENELFLVSTMLGGNDILLKHQTLLKNMAQKASSLPLEEFIKITDFK